MDQHKVKYGVTGFRVRFSEALVDQQGLGSILHFDHVLCNVDNCYDQSTGEFTAPKTGVYSFYLSGVAQTDLQNDRVDLAIERRKNDSRPYGPLTKVFLRAYGDFLTGCQGSGSVRVKLDKGERVVVRLTGGDVVFKGQEHTTFCGVFESEYTDSFSGLLY